MSPSPKTKENLNKLKMKSLSPPLQNELDSLPPVQMRHLLIDMGNVVLAFATMMVPIVYWDSLFNFISPEDRHDALMTPGKLKTSVAVLFFTHIQYWVISAYFFVIEQLGLAHDMFVFNPASRIPNSKILKQVLYNQWWSGCIIFLTVFLAAYLVWPNTFTDAPPTGWQIFVYTLGCSCIWSEIVFYTGHRLLHTKQFFLWHKTHHEMNNQTNVVAWGARYCSFMEDCICNVGAIMCGLFVHCLHPVMIMHWVAHAQWNVICNHTGYHEKFLPVSAALTGMIHHNHHRNGNADFGTTMGWMDWVMGTKGGHHPGSILVTALDAVWVAMGGKSRLNIAPIKATTKRH